MRFNEIISEAGSPAQQAAIAIAMKKAGKKPKDVAEGSLNEFAVSGDGGNDGDDSLFNYAKMWYNGDLKTQRQVEKALQKNGLDIGENEDENGGAYISDISGDYYESWTAEDLEQGVAEGENWSKYNHKRVGGMSKKSVSSYRRSHPGSKIQTAVTTKPSKLKKGSKAAKRRASFCARMRGMKKHRTSAKTAHDPNSNINKSLRRWHCESIEELHELVMLAEQYIRNNKK
jgi:hypothetical protein